MILDEERALAALSKHGSWPVLQAYFQRLEDEEIQAAGYALIHSGTVKSAEEQIGRAHYWKGVRDVLGVPEKAANKLSRELKENDSE